MWRGRRQNHIILYTETESTRILKRGGLYIHLYAYICKHTHLTRSPNVAQAGLTFGIPCLSAFQVLGLKVYIIREKLTCLPLHFLMTLLVWEEVETVPTAEPEYPPPGTEYMQV